MKKIFYSHLIDLKELEIELDTLDIKPGEKDELLHHVHGSIHYKVMDIILSELPENEKMKLVEHLNKEEHERVWEHLSRNIIGVEEKVRGAANQIIQEFKEQIAKHKKV